MDMLAHHMEQLLRQGSAGEASKVAKLIVAAKQHMPVKEKEDTYESGLAAIRSLHRPAQAANFSLEQKLSARMNWATEWRPQGFQHVAVHGVADKVFVWIITKDFETVTIEDEAPMYPSDALVTKIRMLQK